MGMEYCPGGDLYDQLQRRGKLPLATAKFYAAEVVLMLEYLRSKQVGALQLASRPAGAGWWMGEWVGGWRLQQAGAAAAAAAAAAAGPALPPGGPLTCSTAPARVPGQELLQGTPYSSVCRGRSHQAHVLVPGRAGHPAGRLTLVQRCK
jgi:hypothetical protein